MNLQTHISSELWESIESVYNSGNYSHAILEAVHVLTNNIRKRSGVDADGASLVGHAFGGDAPKIRINKLSTETEKNVQKGIEQILRGIYTAIRNPRSHEQNTDTKEAADAIIHFLDYILGIINTSLESFSSDDLLAKVQDPDYVDSKRYAELLISEIPNNKRLEALLCIFKNRKSINLIKVRQLVLGLLSSLEEDRLIDYIAILSEELRTATEDIVIRTCLQMITPELWFLVSEPARLRIENKLLRGIRDGEILPDGKITQSLATWSNSYLRFFSSYKEVIDVLIKKLENDDDDDLRYIAKYFFTYFRDIFTDASLDRFVRTVTNAIKKDKYILREALISNISNFPPEWQSKFATSLSEFTDPENPAVILSDGTPFLSTPVPTDEIDEDDIPF